MISTAVLVRRRRRGTGGGAPATPAAITINSIGPQQSSGDVPVDYTIDKDDSGVQVLLALAATGQPAAALFGADSGTDPSDGAGSGYLALSDVAMTIGGSAINGAIPDGLVSASYQLWYLPTGGGDSDVVGSGAVTIDTTAPAYDSSVPADDATDIAVDSTIAITFDENVVAGSGTFTLYDVTGAAAEETFTVGGSGDNGGTIGIATDTVTLTPGADMEAENDYSVRWTAGAVTDAFSNPVAANAGDTLLNFSTAAAGGAMESDTAKIYWYEAANATRSGTDVTSVPSTDSAGPNLTSIGAFSAPQQADAASPLEFTGATPTVIQTATSAAGNILLTDHMTTGGGSMRMFMVVDADSLGTSGTALFAESQGDGANDSWYFGVFVNGSGNLQFYCRARRFDDAYNATSASSITASGFGLFIAELNVTQTTWAVYINGTLIDSGATDATKFPNPSSSWVSMGARASGTTASVAGTGDLSELYFTGEQNSTTLDAIRTQLATKYSITL